MESHSICLLATGSFISLSSGFSKFIHVVPGVSIPFLFVYITHSAYPFSVKGHLGCFHSGYCDHAAVNMDVHMGKLAVSPGLGGALSRSAPGGQLEQHRALTVGSLTGEGPETRKGSKDSNWLFWVQKSNSKAFCFLSQAC